MKIITAAELMRLEFPGEQKTPEPATRPTWVDLTALEPQLNVLLTEAKAYRRQTPPDFCATAVFFGYHGSYWESLKARLTDLVGWERGGDVLGTSAAYDVAYETIYGALPDCRHDGDCG